MRICNPDLSWICAFEQDYDELEKHGETGG